MNPRFLAPAPQVELAGGFRLGFAGVHADMRTWVGVTSMWNSRPSR